MTTPSPSVAEPRTSHLRWTRVVRQALPGVLAAVLVVSATVKAFVDMDAAWDSVAYHLPFAALKVGIFDPARYQLTGTLQHYFDGFPALPSYLRGWLWLAFGRPEATNLLSVASFLCLVAYLWREWRMTLGWATLVMLAIPVVQVSVARGQIDLPANAFMAIFVLSLWRWVSEPADFGPGRTVIALASAALAANFKPQLLVHVGALLAVVAALLVASLRGRPEGALLRLFHGRPGRAALLVLAALPVILAPALENWIRHRNPFYPLSVQLAGATIFAGPMPPWNLWPDPLYSARWPQAVRWALSVLEFRAFDFRPLPYTLGNGDVPAGAMSMRVGGYMGLAVLVSLWFYVWAVRRVRDPAAWTSVAILLGITALSVITPGSHELRYASYWMIFLVVATITLLRRAETAAGGGDRSVIYRGFLLCTLLYVIAITGADHLWPHHTGLRSFLRAYRVEERLERTVHDTETVCLPTDSQATFFFAPALHPRLAARHPYSVRVEGFTPGGGDRLLSPGAAVCTWLSP